MPGMVPFKRPRRRARARPWWYDADQVVRVGGTSLIALAAVGIALYWVNDPKVLQWALTALGLLLTYWLGFRAGAKSAPPEAG